MANVYATKTGNWSDTSVWNTAALPTSSDDVYANTYTVTIDQDVTVKSLRTTSATSITAGGGFACSTARTIDCSGGTGFFAGSSTALACSNASGTTVTVKGAVNASTTTDTVSALTVTSTGTVKITGNLVGDTGGAGGGTRHVVTVSGNATVEVVGNITGTSRNGSVGINVTGSATVTLTGDITAGTGNSDGIQTPVTGSQAITVTGSVTASSGNGYGINVQSASASLTVTGSVNASAQSGISSTASVTSLTGPFYSSAAGVLPFRPGAAGSIFKLSPISNNEFRFKHITSGTSSLYSSDVNSGAPAATDVRNGTSYAGGLLTGSLKVPSPAYVAAGVQTDATVGTYNPAADVWAYATSSATTAGSMGERLKNAATVDTTGAQLASYGS